MARASITIDEMLVINGLAIMPGRSDRQGGLYLAFPRHKHTDGKVKDTAHPINSETREYIERCVFEAYKSGNIKKRNGAK